MINTVAHPAAHGLPDSVQRFGPAWAVVSWSVLALVAVLGAVAGGDAAEAWAAWPFLVSAVLVGMPHGALDLRLLPRATGSRRDAVLVAFTYLAAIAVLTATLFAAPLVMLALFGVMTVVHFGAADARDAAAMAGCSPMRGRPLWLTAVGRGVFLLSLPFVWDAEGAMAPAVAGMELLGGSLGGFDPAAVRTGATFAVGGGLAATLCGVVLTWRAHGNTDSSTDRLAASNDRLLMVHLGELGLLACAAAMLPPMFFVGAYFLGWHALRHFRRVDRLVAGPSRGIVASTLRQHLWSLPLLLPTLAVYAWVGQAAIGWHSPMAWAVLLLLFFAVLTPAHHWLVERAIARSRTS